VTYWFKRRRFGWGLTPVTWQGWLLLVGLVVLVLVPAFLLPSDRSGALGVAYVVWVIVVVAAFVVVSLAKGPTPRWRWGRSEHDDPDEDF